MNRPHQHKHLSHPLPPLIPRPQVLTNDRADLLRRVWNQEHWNAPHVAPSLVLEHTRRNRWPRRIGHPLGWALLIAALIMLIEVGLGPRTAAAEMQPDVVHVIYHAAHVYGEDGDRLIRIAWCESRFDPLAISTVDGSRGLFQFQPTTWAWASAAAGYAGASELDTIANAFSAAWLMRYEGPSHWTCK